MSASLTQLRKLSDSTAQLLMTDVSSEHVAARATRMLALSRAVDEVDTTTDVADVILTTPRRRRTFSIARWTIRRLSARA